MPTLSESKKIEICDALVKCGVQPNDGAIAAIIELMKNDGRISTATAAKRYAETVGVNHQTQTRNQSRATQGANVQSQTLDNAARGLATQMKQYVGAKAIDYLMEDLAAGDLGAYFDQSLSEAFGTFGAVLDAEYVAIAGGEQPSPLSLPACTDVEAIA